MPQTRERHTAYCREVRTHRRQKAVAYLGGICRGCGKPETGPDRGGSPLDRLHFHHVMPSSKAFNVAHNLTRGWDSLRKELDKCALLCQPCHKSLHSAIAAARREA